jgi:hypothetical protein
VVNNYEPLDFLAAVSSHWTCEVAIGISFKTSKTNPSGLDFAFVFARQSTGRKMALLHTTPGLCY